MKKQFITAQELSNTLGISLRNAYIRMHEMNQELDDKGYQTIRGKIPIAYVKEKFYGVDFGEVENGR